MSFPPSVDAAGPLVVGPFLLRQLFTEFWSSDRDFGLNTPPSIADIQDAAIIKKMRFAVAIAIDVQ